MIHPELQLPRKAIEDFCRRHRIKSLAVFGSATRADFRPDSDVDVLVEFERDAKHSLFDMVHIQDELAHIVGRRIDLVERRGIENSENYIRRKHILNSAETVYVAR